MCVDVSNWGVSTEKVYKMEEAWQSVGDCIGPDQEILFIKTFYPNEPIECGQSGSYSCHQNWGCQH